MGRNKVQLACSLACICLNALTAGSVFTYPLFQPDVARILHLSMRHSSIIAVSALLGQYLSAAFFGSLTDKKGPRTVSLCASALLFSGYGLMAICLSNAQNSNPVERGHPFAWLALASFFVLCGAGTTASYFAAISTATKSFPHHSGLAVSTPCAVLGISPLFLSFIASQFFVFPKDHPTRAGDLDAIAFLSFLAIFPGLVNFLSAIFLKVLPPTIEKPTEDTERAPLIQRTTEDELLSLATHMPLQTLLQDKTFWMFGFAVLFVTGPAEMVVASLGSIVEALHEQALLFSNPSSTALAIRKTHVMVFSLFNTAFRIIAGLAIDLLAPHTTAPVVVHEDDEEEPKKETKIIKFTRINLYMGTAFVFLCMCLFAATGLRDTKQLWAISIITGSAYGIAFTVAPSVVASVWPLRDFGRNFGLLSYFSAAGALIFTLLYGAFSDLALSRQQHNHPGIPENPSPEICVGPTCFRSSFWVASAGLTVAIILAGSLKHRTGWNSV